MQNKSLEDDSIASGKVSVSKTTVATNRALAMSRLSRTGGQCGAGWKSGMDHGGNCLGVIA